MLFALPATRSRNASDSSGGHSAAAAHHLTTLASFQRGRFSSGLCILFDGKLLEWTTRWRDASSTPLTATGGGALAVGLVLGATAQRRRVRGAREDGALEAIRRIRVGGHLARR